jgi:hypothetical protein
LLVHNALQNISKGTQNVRILCSDWFAFNFLAKRRHSKSCARVAPCPGFFCLSGLCIQKTFRFAYTSLPGRRTMCLLHSYLSIAFPAERIAARYYGDGPVLIISSPVTTDGAGLQRTPHWLIKMEQFDSHSLSSSAR